MTSLGNQQLLKSDKDVVTVMQKMREPEYIIIPRFTESTGCSTGRARGENLQYSMRLPLSGIDSGLNNFNV